MASIFGDLINDAKECNSFAHLQNDRVARNASFAEWASRLARIDVADSDHSDELCAVLTGSESPWTLQQKSELSRLISAIGGRNGVNRGRMQKAVNFENMLSEKDWAKMRKNVFEHAGIALLAQRAASLNIKNASEPTLFRMCDILAYCMEKPAFDQTKKLSMKESLQGAIKAEHARITATHHSLPWITEYPFSASELPPALIELAYEGNGPPVAVDIPELNVKNDSKMRPGRHSAPSWLKNVPVEHRHLFMQPSKPHDKEAHATCSPDAQPVIPHDDLKAKPSPSYGMELPVDHTLFQRCRSIKTQNVPPMTQRTAKSTVVKIEITDSPVKPTIKCGDSDDGDGPPPGAGTVEEMEKALLGATKARHNSKPVKKKPAKAPGVVAKAAAKKPTCVAKKPAARVGGGAQPMDMKDVFEVLRTSKKDRSRNNFTSYAYTKGKSRMLNAGKTPEQAAIFARKMHKQASELWLKLA